jgi:hypothetical protein
MVCVLLQLLENFLRKSFFAIPNEMKGLVAVGKVDILRFAQNDNMGCISIPATDS